MDFYPSIPHDTGLQAVYEKSEGKTNKKNLSSDLVEMAEYILKNNFFEFHSKVSRTVHLNRR